MTTKTKRSNLLGKAWGVQSAPRLAETKKEINMKMIIQPIADLVKQSSVRAYVRAGLLSDTRETVCPKCAARFNGEPSKCAAHISLCRYTRSLRETIADNDTRYRGESLSEAMQRWQGDCMTRRYDSEMILSHYGTPIH